MKLYTGPLTDFGGKAHLAILEKNISCQIEYVPFNIRERYTPKHPEVLRINPKKQVPVLVDDSLEIYDSTQIFEYLEDAYPEIPLWPSEPKARARARLMELEIDEIFHMHVQTLVNNALTPTSDEARTAAQQAMLFYDKADAQLIGKNYFAEEYSYVDIAFLSQYYYAAMLGVDFQDHHQNLKRWKELMAKRPAVKEAFGLVDEYLLANGMKPPAFLAA